MKRRQRVEGIIVQAAIKLFGLYTYNGVTLRAVTKEAKVREPALYFWFDSMEALYGHAVNTVVAQAGEQLQELVMKLLAGAEPTPARIIEGVSEWYAAIPDENARLLHQVLTSDEKRDKLARESFEKVVGVIARALEQQKKLGRKVEPHTAAMVLVRALLWGKVHASATAERDKQKVMQFWLQAVSPA